MGVAEVRQPKQLEEGNAKPNRFVADLSFEIAILQEMLRRIV